MATRTRLVASGVAGVLALALTTLPVHAGTRAQPKPTPPAQAKKVPALLPPQIYQVNPQRVNPTVQPNIMILGQYMTPKTTVQVGGHPATTVQVPDTNHLLVKLPEDLSQGSYTVAVTNEAGTATATDELVVDQTPAQSNLLYLVGGGCLLLLFLVMRLARTPSLA
jgi:IPT/TIG domain